MKNFLIKQYKSDLNLRLKHNYLVEQFSDHKSIFKDISDQENNHTFSRDLSIGSDIQKINNKYFLIAHEKIFLNNKRIYFGRLVSLSLFKNKFKIIKIYPHRYIHSYRSLLGTRKKRNLNLISCTYFSGFTYDKNKNTILFSYGVNDFYFSFASVPFDPKI